MLLEVINKHLRGYFELPAVDDVEIRRNRISPTRAERQRMAEWLNLLLTCEGPRLCWREKRYRRTSECVGTEGFGSEGFHGVVTRRQGHVTVGLFVFIALTALILVHVISRRTPINRYSLLTLAAPHQRTGINCQNAFAEVTSLFQSTDLRLAENVSCTHSRHYL